MFNNKNKTIDKKYIVENNNTIVNQLNFVKIEKNKQIKINLIEINKDVKKKVFNAQILNINKAKIYKYIVLENRNKFYKF